MNYILFLADRLDYFHRVVTEGYAGVVLSSRVPINLNAAAMAIAQSTADRRMVRQAGAYEIVREAFRVEDLVSYNWSTCDAASLQLRIQFLHYGPEVIYLCLYSSTKAWYALARVTDPADPILLSKFFASRRHLGRTGLAHHFGPPSEVVNYRPELISGHAVISAYTEWLPWASRKTRRGSGIYPLVPDPTEGVLSSTESLPKSDDELTRALLLVYREQQISRPRRGRGLRYQGEGRDRALVQAQQRLKFLADQLNFLEARHEDTCALLAKLARQTGETKLAVQLVERLVAMAWKSEQKANYLLWLGTLLEDVLDHESALVIYGQALALEPKDQSTSYFIHNNMGRSLNRLKKYQEAEWYCKVAVTADTKRHHAYTNLGVALAGQGEYLRAACCFIQAVSLNPENPRALRYIEDLIRDHPEILEEDVNLATVVEQCRNEVRSRIGGRRRTS